MDMENTTATVSKPTKRCPYCGEEITSNGSISHSSCIIPTDYAYTNSPISYTTVSYTF